ncbi:hypothetical protein GCM10018955_69590 [Planomonospora venezuelensis]
MTSRIATVRQRPTSVYRMIFRRSIASAMAPPHRPQTTMGTNSAALTRPTASGESVSCFICSGTAIRVRNVPNIPIMPEPNSSRKSRESRSGLRSIRMRRSRTLSERSGFSGTNS